MADRILLRSLILVATLGIADAAGRETLRGRPDIPLGSPVVNVASGTQFSPAVASDGEGYLAVWFDGRTGRSEIYATRIDKAGRVLDPMGIRISRPIYSSSPAVGWDGSNYLITWERGSFVHATRLTRAGEVLDPFGIPIPSARYQSVVASGRPTSLVLTKGFQSVMAAVLTPEGMVIKSGILLDSGGVGFPAAIWDGRNYRLVWSVIREFRGAVREIVTALVSPAGEISDRRVIFTGPRELLGDPVRIAWDGSRFLVIYRKTQVANMPVLLPSAVQGILLNGEGATIGEAFPISELAVALEKIDVASDGRSFLVTWSQETGSVPRNPSQARPASALPPPTISLYAVHAASVDPDGSVTALGALTESEQSDQDGSITSNGSDFFMAWVHAEFKSEVVYKYDVMGRVVGPRGPLSAELPLSFSSAPQLSPAVASDGMQHFVVWSEEVDEFGRKALFGIRLMRSGEILDPRPFRISESATDQSLPAVSFNGSHFLVAWIEADSQFFPGYQTLRGRRFTIAGSPIDPASFEIAKQIHQFFPPSVGSNGRTFLIASDNQVSVFDSGDAAPVIKVHRISAIGRYMRPSAAWTGSVYLAVWTRVDAGRPDWGLYGLRVSAAGVPLDAEPFAIAETTASESGSVGCSLGGCVAAWNTLRGIRVGRISEDGRLLDRTAESTGTPIEDWDGNRSTWHPAVFAHGDGYVVVWSGPDAQGIWQLFRVELDLQGRPVAPADLLTGSGEHEYPAALLFDAFGSPALVYQRSAPGNLFGGVNRAFFRTAVPSRRRPLGQSGE